MAKREWLYCNSDWKDLINIIKLEKSHHERLQEFQQILDREDTTIKDVLDSWTVVCEEDIKDCVEEWFFYDSNGIESNTFIYWFFNIYTGETQHIKYTVTVTNSGIITD